MTTLEQMAVDVFSEDTKYGFTAQAPYQVIAWRGEVLSKYGDVRVDWKEYLSGYEMARLNDLASNMWEFRRISWRLEADPCGIYDVRDNVHD